MDKYNTRQTLIAKIMDRHNDQSWDEFTHFYKNYIFSIVIRMGVPSSDREDVTQKALLEIWKALPKFEYRPVQSKFRNWVYTLTKHQALAYFKSVKRHQNKLDKIADEQLSHSNSDTENEHVEEQEWKKHIFQVAWERIQHELSESYRQCFLLWGQGISIDEICAQLDLKKNSVHVYRQRVLKRLTREIRFLDDELG